MKTSPPAISNLYHTLPEATIRLGYYGYISFTLFKTTFDLESIDSTVILGGSTFFLMLQFFLIHHLLKGIQLLLHLASKVYPFLILSSIFGLIFLTSIVVMYGILGNSPLHDPYYLSFLILFFGIVAYLFYKEVNLLISNKDLLFSLFRNAK